MRRKGPSKKDAKGIEVYIVQVKVKAKIAWDHASPMGVHEMGSI